MVRTALVLGLLAATLAAGLSAAGEARAATTFTVNSTGDQSDANFSDGRCDVDLSTSGNQCTLRAAIEQANETSGADAIYFDIPGGSGVKTIRPTSQLANITEAVTIDGYTQPGSKKNTKTVGTNAVLLIELDGSSTGSFSNGLPIRASNVVVRGLVINGFATGIGTSGANTRIEGNFIGTDPSGTIERGNRSEGVAVLGLNATVGGVMPQTRNLISGNSGQGVLLFDSGAKVQGNLIGTKKDGTTRLGNSEEGVDMIDAGGNIVGGTPPGAANTIAFNGTDGIGVFSGSSNNSVGNRILSNSIHGNAALGIELGADGATPNDGDNPATPRPDPDSDTGPNNLQNFPRLTSAKTASGKITIEGNLNSTPEKTFMLQFFSNPQGGDEGKTFIGQKSVTTNAKGNARFTFAFAKRVPAGRTITATATGPGGNTSEFSAPRALVAR